MKPARAFTPAELNRMINSAPTFKILYKIILRYRSYLTPICTASALVRIGKFRIPLLSLVRNNRRRFGRSRQQPILRMLTRLMHVHLPAFSVRAAANAVWGIAKIQWLPSVALLSDVVQHVCDRKEEL